MNEELEGIVHPPDSIVPYQAAMNDAIRQLAQEADVPPLLLPDDLPGLTERALTSRIDRRLMREVTFTVKLRVPEHMTDADAERNLLTCISFGRPEVALLSRESPETTVSASDKALESP